MGMDNLFGIFDPQSSFSLHLNWLRVSSNRFYHSVKSLIEKLHLEIKISLGPIATPGVTWFAVSLFLMIATINYLGLIPYVFTPTSHLRFTLSVSLLEFLAHLVPFGTPLGLIMLIVVIELVSVLIRPITLSVRLAANIVAGHLLISLVCIPSLHRAPVILGCLLGVRVIMVLESAVALIQAYVFSTLSSLYIGDLNSSIKI